MSNQGTTFDLFEFWLVVFGAILGFGLSIATTIVNKAIDKYGKMHLFYKIVHQGESGNPAGINVEGTMSFIMIPLFFEFQNTSNTARVIRDVCLRLYNNGNEVAKMVQIQRYTTPNKNEEVNLGSDKSSYSFVLPPLSIQRQECLFMYKIPTLETESLAFDEIRFSYFNEKNQIMDCHFCECKDGWHKREFEYKNDFIELKCSKKKK